MADPTTLDDLAGEETNPTFSHLLYTEPTGGGAGSTERLQEFVQHSFWGLPIVNVGFGEIVQIASGRQMPVCGAMIVEGDIIVEGQLLNEV